MALMQWYAACITWLAGDSSRGPRRGWDGNPDLLWLAGGSRRALPFGEYGGAVDVLRQMRRYRGDLGPCPLHSGPGEYHVRGEWREW